MVFTTILNFLKAHWQVVALVILIGVGYGWIRHLQASNAAALAQSQAIAQTEVAKIMADKAAADAAHAAELKQLNDSLSTIQANYVAAQQQLAVTQKQETEAIVKQYGTDADGLATLAAQKLGLTVIK